MKNKLTNLNDHLFAQLERLNDENLKGDELQTEITRSKAMTGVAKHIVGNARVILDAAVFVDDNAIGKNTKLPEMFQEKPNLLSIECGKE